MRHLSREQLISVVRKGSRARQQLPALAGAFVWHRLYQQELLRLGVPRGRGQSAWWTLRRPHRPLTLPQSAPGYDPQSLGVLFGRLS